MFFQRENQACTQTTFRLAWLVCLVSLISAVNIAAQTNALQGGSLVTREIGGGQMHNYKISLAANQFLFLTVEQKSADVALSLFNAENQKLLETNSPGGLELFAFVAETGGEYRLEVSAPNKNAPAGNYEAKIIEVRGATAQDARQIIAAKAAIEANNLFTQFNPENLPRVLELYRNALNNWRASGNQLGEAAALKNFGKALVASGERRNALEFFAESLALWQKTKISSEIANTHDLMCEAQSRLSQFQEALNHGEAALEIYRKNGDRFGENGILMLIGNLYANLGDTASALDFYNQALQNWLSLKNQHRVAATLNNIGLVYAESGDAQKAFEFYTQSLQTFRADRPGTRGEANVLNQLGFYYLERGDFTNALAHFNQALPIWKRITDAFGEPSALLGIARVYEKTGDAAQSAEFANQSLALASKRGARSVEASVLFALARAERSRGNLSAARAKIESALEIIEATRASILSRQFRAGYFARTQNLYAFYIDLLIEMNETAAAWQAAERARARSLTEMLAESNADIRQGVEPALLERESETHEKINDAEQIRFQMILQKRPQTQIEIAEANLRRALNELNAVQTDIRRQSPRYAALTQPQALTLTEAQKLLDADTILLEYALGRERGFLFVISQTELKTFVLPARADIENAAREFYAGLKNQAAAPEDISKASENLTQTILAPAAVELSAKRLLIVADGALQFVPFAALQTPKPKVQSSKSEKPGSYLIEEHEIITLPSAATLAILRRETANRKIAPKTVAVIADPVFNANDVRIKSSAAAKSTNENPKIWQKAFLQAAENVRANLPRLPGSRREASAILALTTPEESLRKLDFEANRTTIASADLSQYRYIHFATHGLLDSRQPELTGIVLSLVDRNGKAQNGFLRLHEIYNLKLPVEMVVLSACETGLGKEIRGEGIIGLTRGFFYAGARRVVVSLWQVDDRATSELMRRFYQELLSERRPAPAAALRTAQISLLKEKRWSAPFYWSAFTLQGEWQ